jgi:hypothetical protein
VNGWWDDDELKEIQADSDPRTLLKCMWRCACIKPRPSSVEALVRATMQVRWTFGLTEAQHRLCAEEAFRQGERLLAHDLYGLEKARGGSR